MVSLYSSEQVRASDAALITTLPAGVPMRRAAFGLAQVVLAELRSRFGGVVGRRVGLVVGSGDNGGDALWAGVTLRQRGVAVQAVLVGDRSASASIANGLVHAEGLAALRGAGGRIVDRLDSPDLVLDGVVGISGRGPLRPRAAAVFAELKAPVIAVDLPSGVDPDTGVIDADPGTGVRGPAVTAQVTVAMGAFKPVHVLNPEHCGRMVLVDIGYSLSGVVLPEPVASSLDLGEVGAGWPVPGPRDDKYTQGVTGVIAGSPTYPGAGLLSVAGALAATSGMVRYLGPLVDRVLDHHPEVVATSEFERTGRVNAWVVGPGADESTRSLLALALATDVPVVADAAALRLVPELLKGRSAPTVITPHAGEFEALAGHPPGADRMGAARGLAREFGVTVLLKGNVTVVADPAGRVLVSAAGNAWAATAGSGDVLSGVVGALLAAGKDPLWAAAAAARAHAEAAGLAAVGVLSPATAGAPTVATEIARHLTAAVRRLRATPPMG